MIPLETLLLFVPLAALLVVLPGPDFALIAKISLCDGRNFLYRWQEYVTIQ